MKVQWFTDMPVTLGNLILSTLRDAVPESATILRDIFSETIPDEKADVEQLVPECNASCSGFGLFKTGGPGGEEVSESDAEAAEKIADYAEKLSEQDVKDLLEEAQRRDMLDKPFDQKQAEEMLKDLQQRKKDQKPAAEPGKQPPSQTEPETGKEPQQPQGATGTAAAPSARAAASAAAGTARTTARV
jgi:outer membrane biosynthesis protein TonB